MPRSFFCTSSHIVRSELTLRRWSVGSGLFLASFAAVMGPMNYVYHLFSAPRLPFTTAYFGSIILTLVFAIKVRQPLPSVTQISHNRPNSIIVAKHHPHTHFCPRADLMFAMVSSELLPDGLCWSSIGHNFRGETSYCLDVRLDVLKCKIGRLENCHYMSRYSDIIHDCLHSMLFPLLGRK